MQLLQIWNAREAMQRLAQLKKPPKIAYQMLKYFRLYDKEIATCDKAREEFIYQVAGAAAGSVVTIDQLMPNPDKDGETIPNPKFQEFFDRFNEFLRSDSDLPWSGITMDAMVEMLDAQEGNALSEDDLARIEYFFTEPAKPVNVAHLKPVEKSQGDEAA